MDANRPPTLLALALVCSGALSVAWGLIGYIMPWARCIRPPHRTKSCPTDPAARSDKQRGKLINAAVFVLSGVVAIYLSSRV